MAIVGDLETRFEIASRQEYGILANKFSVFLTIFGQKG